jgi:hypothetical protein
MKKILLFFLAISLFSCKKENLLKDNDSESPTPSTITVSYTSIMYQLYYCTFTYYDVNGVYHQAENHTDKKVENVDFSRPFKVEAQVGLTMYDPVNGAIQNPQNTEWQTKKDGVVVDSKSATFYYYEN